MVIEALILFAIILIHLIYYQMIKWDDEMEEWVINREKAHQIDGSDAKKDIHLEMAIKSKIRWEKQKYLIIASVFMAIVLVTAF